MDGDQRNHHPRHDLGDNDRDIDHIQRAQKAVYDKQHQYHGSQNRIEFSHKHLIYAKHRRSAW